MRVLPSSSATSVPCQVEGVDFLEPPSIVDGAVVGAGLLCGAVSAEAAPAVAGATDGVLGVTGTGAGADGRPGVAWLVCSPAGEGAGAADSYPRWRTADLISAISSRVSSKRTVTFPAA